MNWETSIQIARRATVGKSALGWIAFLCLMGSSIFWFTLFTDLLTPPTLWSPQAVQAFLMVVAYALILPLFYSMLLPTSPAGRLLQKQSWATPGSIAVIAATLFLTYYAGSILLGWWSVQPTIRDTGSALFLTITSLIAAVLVPALSWCVVTPEQWIAQIEQARHVKRIEHAMRMEEAALRAAYARAVSLLNADLTTLTIAQKRELAGILGGFARTQQHALQSIAASWNDMYGVEAQLATIPDQELLAGYQQVAHLLTDGVTVMESSAAYADQARALIVPNEPAAEPSGSMAARPFTAQQERLQAVQRDGGERSAESVQWSTRGPAVDQRTSERPPHPQAYSLATSNLQGAWKRSDLERLLHVSKTQAHTYLKDWQASGYVAGVSEPKDHYRFVEVR